MPKPLTYGSYLCIDELLALQRPQSQPPHHDEMLFIVIHQVYELWFKVMLHEVEAVKRHLQADEALRATRALARSAVPRRRRQTVVGAARRHEQRQPDAPSHMSTRPASFGETAQST